MRFSYKPCLVNRALGDPALYLEFLREKRAFLFDLGDLSPLSNKQLLKVSHVFVSHTHVDHFIGFDQLLRVSLGRPKTITVFGPPGILRNVQGKLQGYSWNLVENYEESLIIKVVEVQPAKIISARFSCFHKFVLEDEKTQNRRDNVLLEESSFRVTSVFVNHQMPVLAFSFQERFHINIKKNELSQRKWPSGPWLDELKKAIYEKRDDDFAINIRPPGKKSKLILTIPLGDLRNSLVNYSPGQKISYVTDMLFEEKGVKDVVELANGSHILFIEAAFLQKDEKLAAEKYHLTATQAGTIAGMAGVHSFQVFHFSPKYTGEEQQLEREALEAYKRNYRESDYIRQTQNVAKRR